MKPDKVSVVALLQLFLLVLRYFLWVGSIYQCRKNLEACCSAKKPAPLLNWPAGEGEGDLDYGGSFLRDGGLISSTYSQPFLNSVNFLIRRKGFFHGKMCFCSGDLLDVRVGVLVHWGEAEQGGEEILVGLSP